MTSQHEEGQNVQMFFLWREAEMMDQRREGREEGIDLASLRHIRGLMETVGWSAKQAMDAMKIPAAEQEKYLAQV